MEACVKDLAFLEGLRWKLKDFHFLIGFGWVGIMAKKYKDNSLSFNFPLMLLIIFDSFRLLLRLVLVFLQNNDWRRWYKHKK